MPTQHPVKVIPDGKCHYSRTEAYLSFSFDTVSLLSFIVFVKVIGKRTVLDEIVSLQTLLPLPPPCMHTFHGPLQQPTCQLTTSSSLSGDTVATCPICGSSSLYFSKYTATYIPASMGVPVLMEESTVWTDVHGGSDGLGWVDGLEL